MNFFCHRLIFFFFSLFLFTVMLTGAMTIIQPGSSAQLVIALLVVLLNILFVLKLAPFVDDADDYLSFLTSFQMLLTLLGGLLIKTDDPTKPTYDAKFMGIAMIVVNSFGFFALVMSLVALHPKCRKKLNGKSQASRKMKTRQLDGTKVAPVGTNNVSTVEEEEKRGLRTWSTDE